ncbi:MAG: hypothetical protein NTW10_08835 [Bacteroidetes bacterium]|nr:hypothetical protein [Bacteroidota bacterium]
MRLILIFIFTFFALMSFSADLSGPWIKTKSHRITLYTRPKNYSKTVSPDSTAIRNILKEQEKVIDYINEALKTDFQSNVRIYLLNYDEAKAKIGTNGGGFCSPNKPRIYFTYYNLQFHNTIRNEYEYIGVHEMVHLIAKYELGMPNSRFFGEGYANAVEGNYGSKMIDGHYVKTRNDSTLQKLRTKGKILTPSQLLYNDSIKEREYYPQIGCFINWLFKQYGVEKINQLYTLEKDQIENGFNRVTGETFITIEKKYMKSINL